LYRYIVVGVVEHQMRKVELKMRYFEDLEAGLNREREQIARMKQHIFAVGLCRLNQVDP
jgi:hypothetical protein